MASPSAGPRLGYFDIVGMQLVPLQQFTLEVVLASASDSFPIDPGVQGSASQQA